MTVETATNFINHSMDREIIEELEAAFDGFRSRIAMLSVEACGTLTSMFTPLGPVDVDVIDTGVEPADAADVGRGSAVESTVTVGPRSIVVLTRP
mgnify:CR=1 FL=1